MKSFNFCNQCGSKILLTPVARLYTTPRTCPDCEPLSATRTPVHLAPRVKSGAARAADLGPPPRLLRSGARQGGERVREGTPRG